MDTTLLDKLDDFEEVSRCHLSDGIPVFEDIRPVPLSSVANDLYNFNAENTGSALPPADITPDGTRYPDHERYPDRNRDPDKGKHSDVLSCPGDAEAEDAEGNRDSALHSPVTGEIEKQIRQAYEAGMIMGQKKNAADQKSFGDSIGATLASFTEAIETLRTEIIQQQSDLATDILKKLLPASMKTRAGYEILALIRSILEKTAGKKVEIHLPPAIAPEFSRQLDPYRDQITLFENRAVKPGTSRMRWQGGGADIDVTEAVNLCLQCLGHASECPSEKPRIQNRETVK